MTAGDRKELIALYVLAVEQHRSATSVLTAHGKGTSVPTRAELKAVADTRERMLELRRVLWPGWIHA